MSEFLLQVKVKADTFKKAVNSIPEELGEVIGGTPAMNRPLPVPPKAPAPAQS